MGDGNWEMGKGRWEMGDGGWVVGEVELFTVVDEKLRRSTSWL